MIYRKVSEDRYSSYLNLGSWIIGCIIIKDNVTYRSYVEVNGRTVLSADFMSLSSAKAWNTRKIKDIVSSLQSWLIITEKDIRIRRNED